MFCGKGFRQTNNHLKEFDYNSKKQNGIKRLFFVRRKI
ncbi:hypothetical protein RC62_4362 [Flavobacterium aquidurense]|uniref:Uncharacterized protein n=1 Tax=Flavobacterium aquidurense TaxID=362413 RepID=A0A0Q0RV77_9FLAO|nr:hypothetical protein RC62_4362 [Flavobacterium aquidurense]